MPTIPQSKLTRPPPSFTYAANNNNNEVLNKCSQNTASMILKEDQRSWLKIECARGRNPRQCYEGLQEACSEHTSYSSKMSQNIQRRTIKCDRPWKRKCWQIGMPRFVNWPTMQDWRLQLCLISWRSGWERRKSPQDGFHMHDNARAHAEELWLIC